MKAKTMNNLILNKLINFRQQIETYKNKSTEICFKLNYNFNLEQISVFLFLSEKLID